MCHYHGARAGRPPVNGRYTKLAEFSRRIERSLTDPDQLNLRAEIGILGVMLDDLAGQMFSQEPSSDPAITLKLAKKALAAVTNGDQGKAGHAIRELVDLLEGDLDQRHTRDEFRSTVNDLKGIISTQISQDLLRATMIPVSVVWKFIELNQALIFEFVPDSVNRSAYMSKLKAAIGSHPPRAEMIDAEFQPLRD